MPQASIPTESTSETLQRLQALITREFGAPLSPGAQEEMWSILCGSERTPAAVAISQPAVSPREVTILLADLRGFTALTATHAAGDVIDALNHCLGRLSEVVFQYGGHIDKFTGDSLMVLFGTPEVRPDDVERALQCAIKMQMVMRDLNLGRLSRGVPPVFMGIGINTGTVMAGRFGSQGYSEYTVIGEAVYLASRIEAFTLRGQVLMSEATYDRCWGRVSAGPPLEVHVKGRAAPVTMRELVAIPSLQLKVPRQEFRRSHRVQALLQCQCQHLDAGVDDPLVINAAVLDIGYHGLQVESEEPLALDGQYKVAFHLDHIDYRAVDVRVRVVSTKVDAGRHLAGLEFTDISHECNAKVQQYVQLLVGGD